MYRVITNKAEAYKEGVQFKWAVTDYFGACELLNHKPITKGTFYRRIRNLATTYIYPLEHEVALKATVDVAVLQADLKADEHAISSKALTKWYVKEFYRLNTTISSDTTRHKGAAL